MRILVAGVDDRPDTGAAAALGRGGYVVDLAVTAAAAQARLGRMGYDLLVLQRMRDRHGLEVCRAVRAVPAWSSLRVLMLGTSGVEEQIQALDAGADVYLARPFGAAELLARVRALLRRPTPSSPDLTAGFSASPDVKAG